LAGEFGLVAIFFLLFGVSTIFLVPWAVVTERLGVFGLVEMGIFLGFLGFGLVYVWKKGVLDWGSSGS
jgi:NADH-quinone oxidoreductase subunit A